nr:gp165 [uncultured Mediterranean phage uvMED]
MKRVIATLLLFAAPAQAQMSSTAAPVANSSGSVTNQAVQVVPSRQFTNTYGGGISCQGATLNINPFVSTTTSWANPYEKFYSEPVYDTLDLTGATDPEGNAVPDGVPDNPGNVLYYRPIRTGQKSNYSINGGVTATISIPLDRSHIRSCRRAAEKQVALLDAQLADKRLNYEIARLKNCADLMKDGVMFHPDSPYASICADVVLVNPPGVVAPHTHTITYGEPAETSDAQQQTQEQSSSQASP